MPDLVKHSTDQARIARREGDHNGFRIFAYGPENELLESGPQRNSMFVTSPVVRNFASDLPTYWTTT